MKFIAYSFIIPYWLLYNPFKKEVEHFISCIRTGDTPLATSEDGKISLEIAQKNLANNDTIYKIGQGRYNLGRIAENELLDLELNVMNSRQQVAQALLDLETSGLRLKTFVGITFIENVTLNHGYNIRKDNR